MLRSVYDKFVYSVGFRTLMVKEIFKRLLLNNLDLKMDC